jgi:hypothetical protein
MNDDAVAHAPLEVTHHRGEQLCEHEVNDEREAEDLRDTETSA